ncbi:type I polyketide synthase [Acetivibrio straminisolvens]|jgi:acyl transferase domain-containing protein/acyl-CoA synthetase (AMP-forming)/AMP-acid ligase II/acyl carrier protein/NADP-dependent 3-hydroxy acid dehydrogenase YdfG|uniref:type I polyketide synthase n=1 Tax=Acetivibrio straminisolvens TaxID=253314 RepID=UPI0022400D79|nr:type I polyketide synthase [Acetivibrio straminisolvens]
MKSSKENNNKRLSEAKGADITGKYLKKGNIAYLLIDSAKNRQDEGMTFIMDDDSELFMSYEQIRQRAILRLGGMQKAGLKKGQYVILLLDNNIEFVITFWACIFGGIIPAPLTYPVSTNSTSTVSKKIVSVWEVLGKPYILSDRNLVERADEFRQTVGNSGMKIFDVTEYDIDAGEGKMDLAESNSTAFIQFSSGSTSTPKGVILTHSNLLTNIEGIISSAGLTEEDSSLGWMPYQHDMGLIGFHLTTTALGITQINMTPYKFVKKPELWLELISKHRITLTGSPNFGYKLVLNRIKREQLKQLDLSCLRYIFNGAEPISVSLMEKFMEKLSVCGLRKNTMFTVYGMAEACLAVCFPIPYEEPVVHSVSREDLVSKSKVTYKDREDKDVLLLADEGYPVRGIEVRIVDEKGNVVTEGTVGEIQIRGGNVTSGYINNPEANKACFQDGWLKTGDTGFMINGRVTVVGRLKDIIFVNGQNFFAHDIEAVIEEMEGVKFGKTIVCGWHDEKEGREKVALFSTMRIKKDEAAPFYSKIVKHVNEVFGIPIDYVVNVPSIPKTTSGKIQRFALVEAFRNGAYKGKVMECSDMLCQYREEDLDRPENESKLAQTIRSIWAKALEKPENTIPYDQPFLSIGGTSIKAIQVLNLLEEELGLNLTHDILIKCRTVKDMEEYIENMQKNGKLPVESVSQNHEQNAGMDEDDDIAVISMACRFPDSKSPEEFWSNIVKGKSSIGEIPLERWNADDYYSKEQEFGKTYCRTGAFIDNCYDFDAGLFNIADEEAEIMDPQQRIVLELMFELIERAGYSRQSVDGKRIALYLTASNNSFYEYHLNTLNKMRLQKFKSVSKLSEEQQESLMKEWDTLGVTEAHPNILVDNIPNMIAARASQEFNLKGPALVVDTACSSSLVALHMACESIKRGECEMAVAGGINLLLTPTSYIYFSSAGALSRSGESKVFDADADGFVPGEGAGLVLLKPLKKAIADKDDILAVIKASAINNDGRSIGVMSPNPDGQREVIESLYRKSNMNPATIQYVETHGTGTKIGDPSEIRALDNAYKNLNPALNSIAVGSIKANIGHLLNAAGIASFIKVVLALKNKKIPPQINVYTPNPMIKFERTPFYIPMEAKDWEISGESARRAAINSFGFGGTNCHIVVEENPENAEVVPKEQNEMPKHLLCLSANTQNSLRQKIANLADFLEKNSEYSIGDVCYTENVLRTSFKHRCFTQAKDMEELIKNLRNIKLQETVRDISPKVAFMFTGQGSQYVKMGWELYRNLPGFKKYMDICSEAFLPYINARITDLIYGEEADDKILAQTNITQPVMFAIDYSLGMLMLDLGVKPQYVMGHSLGEWVAACVAGAVSLEDAARLVSLRGRLMSELKSNGAMAAVFTSAANIDVLLEQYKDSLWVAGYNVTHQVVSGKAEAMDEFMQQLQKKGIVAKRLNVSQAFHTPLMTPMLNDFRKALEATTFHTPNIAIVSNITAENYDKPFTAEYWLEHILGAVKFEQSIKYMFDKGVNILVEMGPDKTLTGMAKGVMVKDKTILSTMDRKKDNWDVLLDTLGRLYESGIKLDFGVLYGECGYKKVYLPAYPFNRKTYRPLFGEQENEFGKYQNWVYEWSWRREDAAVGCEIKNGAVIVFGDENMKNCLKPYFNSDKNTIYSVSIGEEYSYDGRTSFTINPAKQEDYIRLMEDIKGKVSAVIHMWNYSSAKNSLSELLENDELFYKSAYSLILLGKALIQRQNDGVRLLAVTNKAFSISDEEGIMNPYQSIAVTFGQAMGMEIKGLVSGVLDMDYGEYTSLDNAAKVMVEELSKMPDSEAITVIRKGIRFVRCLKKTVRTNSEKNISVNDGETYLITGGAGQIGGEIAKAIAKLARVNLVLTGRGELDSSAFKIDLIRSIEEMGSKVMYYAVDVSDKAKMEEMIRKVNEQFGPIHGVVHAAGILDESSYRLLEKDIDTIKRVLRAKVQGTIATDTVTKKEPLKFFVSISSVSASKKEWSAGIADYAAANHFLDSYSIYRAKTDSPGKSLAINYSLWAGEGKGIASGDIYMLAVKSQGLRPLPADDATEAFMRVLNYSGQNVVHIMDLMEERKEDRVEKRQLDTSSYEKKKKIPYMSAKEIRKIIYGIIADEIGIDADSLDESMNFLDMGLGSVDATKTIDKIGKALGMELYPTLIFEYQTPQALSRYIEEICADSESEVAATGKDVYINTAQDRDDIQDIAIIGIGLRIPGASTLDEYWDILKNGRCVIREVPKGRWSMDEDYSSDRNLLHTSYTKFGGFIDRPYDFDPAFFGMSPLEAEATDPQQRIFLQVAWEAIQQAGYGGKYKSNKIGVFVGCEQNTYSEHFIGYKAYMDIKKRIENSLAYRNMSKRDRDEIMRNIIEVLEPGRMSADTVAGNGLNEIAARVSHCLNLSGPSLIVNSACSSSLVALHLACESLRTGQADMAIAGGINLNLSVTPFIGLSRVTALSPTGACYPFDRRADGMVLAEGASAVLLKPLKHALRDRDNIFAVIKGSAINNDGHSRGITAPRPQGQAEVIRNAYIRSGIDPETVSYIETHGTGTPLGDPIEVEGMTYAMRSFTSKKQFCGIGSVKSSVGHMLSAAGLVSVIKVVLALKNKMIPHTVNYEEPNPNIDFENSPFYVVSGKPMPWISEGLPLRAGVNAFGFGGTNAHVILEEAPETMSISAHGEVEKQKNVLLLTGRNQKVVKTVVKNLREHMEKNPELDLPSVCFTMNHSQKEMTYKAAVVTDSREHLLNVLSKIEADSESPEIIRGSSNPNRLTPLNLIFDSSFELPEADICEISKRFSGFKEAYDKCMQTFKDIGYTGKDSRNAKDIESFALQLAFGMMLKSFEISIKSIICEGTAVLAGAALTGILSIRQAAEFLMNKTHCPDIGDESNDADGTLIKCPIITSLGIINRENSQRLIKNLTEAIDEKLSREACLELLIDRDAVVYLGNRESVRNMFEAMKIKNLQWLEIDIDKAPVESILAMMAKLYTIGVSFNPSELSINISRRVILPTYPFENSEYKISFEEDSEISLKKLKVIEPLESKKIMTGIEELKRDLGKIG